MSVLRSGVPKWEGVKILFPVTPRERTSRLQKCWEKNDPRRQQPPPSPWTGPFRFMDLSPELRARIILFTLPTSSPLPLASFKTPALARVSEQTRHETLPLFFSECTFLISLESNLEDRNNERTGFQRLPSAIRAWHRNKAGRVVIEQPNRDLLDCAGDLIIFRNLKFMLFRYEWYNQIREQEKTRDQKQHEVFSVDDLVMSTLEVHMHPRRDLKARVVKGARHPNRAEMSGTRLSNGRQEVIFEGEDVDAAMLGMEWVVNEVAERDEFKGFTLEDIRSVAKGCCFAA